MSEIVKGGVFLKGEPVPSELNEIDWKSGLSDKTDRLAQHISAFANHLYGGILVYGLTAGAIVRGVNILASQVYRFLLFFGNKDKEQILAVVRFNGVFNLYSVSVLSLLDYQALYRILDKNVPKSTDTILAKLKDMEYCHETNGKWSITNLGAILRFSPL